MFAGILMARRFFLTEFSRRKIRSPLHWLQLVKRALVSSCAKNVGLRSGAVSLLVVLSIFRTVCRSCRMQFWGERHRANPHPLKNSDPAGRDPVISFERRVHERPFETDDVFFSDFDEERCFPWEDDSLF